MDVKKDLHTGADRLLWIATGAGRRSKHWKNEEISWSDFRKKLSRTTRTRETTAEYKAMAKTNRDAIKDVGGFVGGLLKQGRRRAENVANRSMLTLDMDAIDTTVDDVWDSITMFFNQEMVLYSTHSHRPEAPRLRLIIPLSRQVVPDEYQAVARKVAEDIGLAYFDPTTFEPSRLMYWPSSTSDGEYIYKHVPGAFLDPDTVLDRYEDWRDVSQWPSSERLDGRITDQAKRQEDPLTKEGIVGAFCRAYSIHDAIDTFLSDVYDPTGTEGRYTYKAGSTVGGLVVYDDKFAYSHHGTDPSSGQLCNAFDLVRIHLFGGLDDEAKENTPSNRLPSFTKMVAMAREDDGVKIQLGKERLASAEDDFEFDEGDDDAWLKELSLDKKGNVENAIKNSILILENDPRLAGKLKYDAFANRAYVADGVPWTKDGEHDWRDNDDSGLRLFMESNYGLTVAYKIDDAKNLTFERHRYHPVREYLHGLTWDGAKRIETMFMDYLGAEDNVYTREVAVCHMVAAVARVMRPGTKYDQMVTLVGAQGIGKSTFISKLAKGWYSDSLDTVKGKEAAELIQGVWHVEVGELNATRKADREAVKAFLSKQEDIYRVAYAKNTSRFPRQCVFWGTTNDERYLRDPTGERRAWPIDCYEVLPTKSVFDDLAGEVDQLWAEAYVLYKQGTNLLLSDEAEVLAIEMQHAHKEDTPLSGLIEAYLDTNFPADWDEMDLQERLSFLRGDSDTFTEAPRTYRKDRVCVMEVWCEVLGKRPGDLKPINSREINDILGSLRGWEKEDGRPYFKIYGQQRSYTRTRQTF